MRSDEAAVGPQIVDECNAVLFSEDTAFCMFECSYENNQELQKEQL